MGKTLNAYAIIATFHRQRMWISSCAQESVIFIVYTVLNSNYSASNWDDLSWKWMTAVSIWAVNGNKNTLITKQAIGVRDIIPLPTRYPTILSAVYLLKNQTMHTLNRLVICLLLTIQPYADYNRTAFQ